MTKQNEEICVDNKTNKVVKERSDRIEYRRRRSLSLSVICGATAATDRRMCLSCVDGRRVDRQEKESKFLSIGMCIRCGTIPHRKYKKTCEPCAKRYNDTVKKGREKRVNNNQCINCGIKSDSGSLPSRRCGKCREYFNKDTRTLAREERRMVLEAYGNACACCGEKRERFLCIDHIFSDGAQHRQKLSNMSICKFLIRNDFPKDKFQILCYNCNSGRDKNLVCRGVCPHEEEIGFIRYADRCRGDKDVSNSPKIIATAYFQADNF